MVTYTRSYLGPLAAQLSSRFHAANPLLKAEGQHPGGDSVVPGLGIGVGIIAVIIVVICLVPICIIAILTLMGPTIGNVFSGIVTDLEATP